MITLKNPALVHQLSHYPVGLFPAQVLGGQRNVLVVKCSKEMILAAKVLRELRFYLFPLARDGVQTYGLVTAFFDDPDEPLVIRTPLLEDELGTGILDLLCSPTFDIHFFDEHDREFLGYRVNNTTSGKLTPMRDKIRLAASTYSLPWREFDDQLSTSFSNRTSEDDDKALVVEFVDELFPSDFMIMDTRPAENSYQGSKHTVFTSLERENPGVFAELDIVKFLHRVFPAEQIFLNPLRPDNGKEFVDVMVVTPDNLLLIQAKDSPNTKETLRRPIKRKISTVVRHLRKATAQLRGSISYVESNDPFTVQCGDGTHAITAGNLNVTSLVIVKEMYPTEYKSYTRLAFEVFGETGVPCFIQDYSHFHHLTYHRRTEQSFFATLDEILRFAIDHNEFPQSRFWL